MVDDCKKNNRQSTKVFSEKNLRMKINIKHASIITLQNSLKKL